MARFDGSFLNGFWVSLRDLASKHRFSGKYWFNSSGTSSVQLFRSDNGMSDSSNDNANCEDVIDINGATFSSKLRLSSVVSQSNANDEKSEKA